MGSNVTMKVRTLERQEILPVETIGDRIAFMRKRWGWTQKQLADEAGVSRETVASIESNRSVMRMDAFQRVMVGTGMNPESVYWIVTGIEAFDVDFSGDENAERQSHV